MAFRVEKYVLWLKITICHTLLLVQKLKDEADLGSVEYRGRLIESVRASEVRKHLTTRTIIQLALWLAK